ncbi:MAG TPA: CHAT domain-containing protein [Planctomycetota bacterium]|nr:CHAT domain-containing protein [Planctomycetota bacterium]
MASPTLTRQQPKQPKQEEYGGLAQKLLDAGPGQVAAARDELIAWLEALDNSTTGAAAHDPDALMALYAGSILMAQWPDQRAKSDAWYGLADKAVGNMQIADMHRYFHTGMLVTQAQDLLAHKDEIRARKLLERALAEDVEPRLAPLTLHTLADVQRRAGTKTVSLETVKTADQRIAALGPGFAQRFELQAQSELLRTQLYNELGVPDLAWSALLRCKEAAIQADNPQLQEHALLFEVNLLLATDRKQEVIKLLRPGGKERIPPLPARLQMRLGKAFADMEPMTAEYAEEASTILSSVLEDEALDPEDRRSAYMSLVDFQIRQGDLESAEQSLEAAKAELARILQEQKAGMSARDQAEIEAYSSHLLRARGLDKASGKEQLASLKQAYDRMIDDLQGDERSSGGVGFLHFRTRRFMLNELIELSLAVEGEEHGLDLALEALIEAQELGSLSRALKGAACTPVDVRKLMTSAEGGVLVFVPDHHRTLVLAFDAKPSGLCKAVAAQGVWAPLVDQWLNDVSTAPSGDEKSLARNLAALERHGKLVADTLFPAEIRARMAGWKSVTIVGADLMDGLPFEAIPLGGPEVLGIRFAIDRAPSLPVQVKLANRRAKTPPPPADKAGLWLVAAPAIPAWADPALRGLAPIPFNDANRKAVQKPYPKLEQAFIGETATRAALEAPGLCLASVLQVTAHGTVMPKKERSAALVLRPMSKGDDGILDCDEVEEKLHVPDTVVLSSCSAAHSEQRYGEDGLNHLGGAFMFAGASCVVLSSHPVEAGAMQALMEVFHQRLSAGDSRAESMRAAREAVAKNPRFPHPFYYSLVQVTGLGQMAR